MEFKQTYFVLIVFAGLAVFVAATQKYRHISDCHFYDRGFIFGEDNVTFICGESDNEETVFTSEIKFNCSNHLASMFGISTLWTGLIDFKNCEFTEINRNYFKLFPFLHTFIISNVGLKKLQPTFFRDASNITTFAASNNSIAEIPSLLFIDMHKLEHADFSNNTIKRVDGLAFAGASNLKSLNLSHNELTEFDPQVFKVLTKLAILNLSHNKFTEIDTHTLPVASLEELDISHNSLTTLKEHALDRATNLRALNLAFNPIKTLNVDAFTFLSNLKHLNLRRTNITNIRMGTFSNQHSLVSLDLSENGMKNLNFKLFSPVLHDLKTLKLAGNELQDLNGFRNTLFPQLATLDIRNNAFECSYLHRFMESVNWEKLRLSFDQQTVNPMEPSVRGIKCDGFAFINEPEDNNSFEICSKSHDDTFIKVFLVLIFIVMLAYLIVFLALNRDRILKQFNGHTVTYFPNKRQSTTTSDPEYSTHEANEELLLK